MSVIDEFKKFLLRGNLVDLAVGIVIGVAFTAVITAVVADLVTPLIAAIGGQPDFSNLDFKINGSTFMYGDFVNKLLSFLITALVIFFFVIKPVNVLMSRMNREPPPDPTTKKCPECLSVIPIDARRCAHCTVELSSVMAVGSPGS